MIHILESVINLWEKTVFGTKFNQVWYYYLANNLYLMNNDFFTTYSLF